MCQFDEERVKAGSDETVGNRTFLGQIASFMEVLHLSYTEVFEVLPYRNLLIMQKDKLHAVHGEKVKKISGKELAARRKNRR